MRVYERKDIYSVDAVLKHVPVYDETRHIDSRDRAKAKIKNLVQFDGDQIDMDSQRYQVFMKSCQCVTCGIEGQYFAKERLPGSKRYHFNLYAIDAEGVEVMITKDHIIPKSLGGLDTLSNYQTMCAPCNRAKGNKIDV